MSKKNKNDLDFEINSRITNILRLRESKKAIIKQERQEIRELLKLVPRFGSIVIGDHSINVEAVKVRRLSPKKVREKYPKIVPVCEERSSHVRIIFNNN